MEEASSSKPRRIDERSGVDDERIAFPFTDAVPIVRCDDRRLRITLASVRRDVPEFRVSSTVIGILSIEHEDVFIGLDNPEWRALSWESQRLARHDGIVLVRPLIEFLNLVPKLGFVNGTTRHPKPRRRDPLIIHPEVVHRFFAFFLRWTTSAGSTTRDWIRG